VRSNTTSVGVTSLAGIQTIGEIHKNLMEAFEKNGDVRLGVASIADVDLTFVQLIESARRYAAAKSKRFTVSTPPPKVLRDLLERGGFLVKPADRSFWLGKKGSA
jgi:hypothetical protein